MGGGGGGVREGEINRIHTWWLNEQDTHMMAKWTEYTHDMMAGFLSAWRGRGRRSEI